MRSAERERLSLARLFRLLFSFAVGLSSLGALLAFESVSVCDSRALSTAEKASVAGSFEEFLFFCHTQYYLLRPHNARRTLG